MSETVGNEARTPAAGGGAPALIKQSNPFEATSKNILSNTGGVVKVAQSFDRT